MGYWFTMLFYDLLIPAILIILGILQQKLTPEKPAWFFGYRTRRARASQAVWKFAQNHSGMLCIRTGWILAAPTLLSHLFFWRASQDTLSTLSHWVTAIQLASVLLTSLLTEAALKKHFDREGRPLAP